MRIIPMPMTGVTKMSMRFYCGLVVIVCLCLLAAPCSASRTERKVDEEGEHIVPLSPAEADRSLPATHEEIGSIGSTEGTRFGNLTTFCMTRKGNLLACDAKTKGIKSISPEGRLVTTWKMDFSPYSICEYDDGTIYVAGYGKVVRLSSEGRIMKMFDTGTIGFGQSKTSGIAVTEKDVFVSFGSGRSLRSRSDIVRFDRDLSRAVTIAQDMRGCCQRLDLTSQDGVLYVAENTRHRVVRYDREGKVLSMWGQRDRKRPEGFGSCCNPMNLCFGPGGELYTAESGLGRIKRYSPRGRYLGLVGHAGVDRFNRAGRLAASCSNIALAVNKDGSRVYVLDFKNNIIRILARVSAKPQKHDSDDNSDGQQDRSASK